jgi:hypothetical protein
MDGACVGGVEVETKGGRGRLAASVVIDATGDADLAQRAGAPCVLQDNWMSFWSHQISKEKLAAALESGNPGALLQATCLRLGANDSGKGHPEGQPKHFGVTAEQVTRFVLEGRRLLREYYRAQGAPRDELFSLTLPAMAQFRTTRRIVGLEAMIDGQAGLRRESSVGLTGDWRKPGPAWEIPYGALLPRGVSGLLVAGRCIDASGDAWQVTRVIPPAALTGQAAGAAAALAAQSRLAPHMLPPERVQSAMRARGVPVHIEEVIH